MNGKTKHMTNQSEIQLLAARVLVIPLLFLLSFAGKPVQTKSDLWVSCYQSSQNTLFFQNSQNIKKNCESQIKFSPPPTHHLIENSQNYGAFSETRAGTKRSMVLEDGRQILISQWSLHGRSNDIIVLEPDFKNNTVNKLCVLSNRDDPFSARYNHKTKTLYVQVTKEYKHRQFKKVWKSCPL